MVKIVSSEKKLHNGAVVTEFKLSQGTHPVRSLKTGQVFDIEKFALVGAYDDNPLHDLPCGSEFPGQIIEVEESCEESEMGEGKYLLRHTVRYGFVPEGYSRPIAITTVKNVISYSVVIREDVNC